MTSLLAVRFSLLFIGVLAATLLTGCTVVEIRGADGVSRSGWFGVLRVVSDRPSSWVVVRTEGVGVVPGWHGVTFGYRKEYFVTGEQDGCRAIFIVEKAADASVPIKLIKELQLKDRSICLVTTKEK
jgi:hypothetical protein